MFCYFVFWKVVLVVFFLVSGLRVFFYIFFRMGFKDDGLVFFFSEVWKFDLGVVISNIRFWVIRLGVIILVF